jgi:hypothetical protein
MGRLYTKNFETVYKGLEIFSKKKKKRRKKEEKRKKKLLYHVYTIFYPYLYTANIQTVITVTLICHQYIYSAYIQLGVLDIYCFIQNVMTVTLICVHYGWSEI